MVTAEELTVAIRSEGVGETRENLQGVERSMEDTADQAGASAEELEGFTQRIQGAMAAAAAGVAIAAGSLLTQIPIIGEFAAGLGAIFDALGLQVDQLIRDLGGGGLTDVLFNVAGAINDAEGTMADFIGAITAVATIVAGAAAGVAAWAIKVKSAAGAASALIGALKTVGSALAAVVAGISATTAAIAIAVAAIVGFAAAYATNFRGVRDTTNRIIGQIIDFVVSGFTSLATRAVNALGDFASRTRSVLVGVADGFVDWAGGLASSAREWGATIMERFIDGLRSMLSVVREVLSDIPFIGQILNLFDRLSEAISDLDLSGSAVANLDISGGGGNGGGGGTTSQSGRPAFGGGGRGGGGDGAVRLDGRDVSEDTGRYRADPSLRRGI